MLVAEEKTTWTFCFVSARQPTVSRQGEIERFIRCLAKQRRAPNCAIVRPQREMKTRRRRSMLRASSLYVDINCMSSIVFLSDSAGDESFWRREKSRRNAGIPVPRHSPVHPSMPELVVAGDAGHDNMLDRTFDASRRVASVAWCIAMLASHRLSSEAARLKCPPTLALVAHRRKAFRSNASASPLPHIVRVSTLCASCLHVLGHLSTRPSRFPLTQGTSLRKAGRCATHPLVRLRALHARVTIRDGTLCESKCGRCADCSMGANSSGDSALSKEHLECVAILVEDALLVYQVSA